MICSFCSQTVLGSARAWGFHRDAATQLARSTQERERCVLCRQLDNDFRRSATAQATATTTPHVYRWTLRPAPQIRESRRRVVLTFRPLPEFAQAGLPDRVFHFVPEEDLGDLPVARGLGDRTNSDQSWKTVLHWFKTCQTTHTKCQHNRKFVPTRLVDAGSSTAPWPPEALRVLETGPNDIHGPYMTLSHCWGEKLFVELRDHNKDEFMNGGIPWKEFSSNKNFVDAILVARKLGVRYIWIDSLCIIQRQTTKPTDFEKEGPMMHSIYRHSFCNIAAAASSDKDGGLFRERKESLEDIIPARYVPTQATAMFGTTKWRIVLDDFWDRELLKRVLYTRGWVFQERLLSPRLLHYSETQVFWDCATLTACETFPSGLPHPLNALSRTDRHWRERLQGSALNIMPLGASANDSLEEFWRSAVRYYTSCSLRFGSDKLFAVWGIAKLVRDAMGEDYGAGLWTHFLHEQLAWRVSDPRSSARPEDQKTFPSWSWASVRGTVEVAGRVSAQPRWYTVKDHDGGPLTFHLEEYLHRRETPAPAQRWRDEFIVMDRNISSMSAKFEALADKNYASVKDIAMSGTGSRLSDQPSALRVPHLSIEGHLVPCRMSVGGSARELSLDVGSDRMTEAQGLRLYPDCIETSLADDLAFFVLAASRFINMEWSDMGADDDEFEESDFADAEYTGIGLIVRRVGEGKYERLGSLTFNKVSHDVWRQWHSLCCKNLRAESDGEHQLDGGEKFKLV